MCGIVGAISQRNVSGILLEGLKRLEYRGYDSAGLAVLKNTFGKNKIQLCKRAGKVENVEAAITQAPLKGYLGIAHTRWATHGEPSEKNAHPHISQNQRIAVVHNGIIENYASLKKTLQADGVQFVSDTDTEVIAHFIEHLLEQGKDLLSAVNEAASQFQGAYALGVIDVEQPDVLVAARSGSPLVIGVGIEENFIASDPMALRQVTDRFIYLEEGDIAELNINGVSVYQAGKEGQIGKRVNRKVVQVSSDEGLADKGEHEHYMYKEMLEQPRVLAATLDQRIKADAVLLDAFPAGMREALANINSIHIVACGTSYHAGMIAKHWVEEIAGLPCSVDVASEYRYRNVLVGKNTLFLSISQSGETADTLAALRARREQFSATMTVCNVDNSSLVRESDFCLLTKAGPEIGVASTKAFTTQLAALQLLALTIASIKKINVEKIKQWVLSLHDLPVLAEQMLALDEQLKKLAPRFANKHHALFLGRGIMYPIAKEGALKLKEISYIHAEAYAAGELKHGPLALVDEDMPVIAVAPNNDLLEKLKSNLQEVRARGGELYVFADKDAGFKNEEGVTVIALPHVPENLAPIAYTIPLQLLSYYVAVIRGTDVDKPRNLAKSVTVE